MRSGGIRFWSLLAICLGLTAVIAPAAYGAPNDIAYRCHNSDICLLDSSAPANIRNLTDGGGGAYPFWSPDGSRVGFTSKFVPPNNPLGPGENLFTMDPNATGNSLNVAVQLTNYTSGVTRHAEWSPDGSKVAFIHGSGSNYGVFVVNSDGSSATPVTIASEGNGPGTADVVGPSFSPDGTKIAYSHGEQIYIANADGSGTPQPLAGATGHSPAWSPDGTKIALDVLQPSNNPFVSVKIVNVDGSGTPVVLPLNYSQWSYATWSPDGKRIALRDTAGGGFGFYRVANADGTGNHPLAQVTNQNDGQAPSWSPDGSKLAFSAYTYNPISMTGTTDVHTVTTAGTSVDQKLTSGGMEYDAIWKRQAPVATPPVQPPLPGQVKPKLVWITKRIPWQPGQLIRGPAISCPVGSSDARCVAAALANGRGGGRTSGGRRSLRGKPRTILVARARTVIPAGKTRRLSFRLTRAGKKLLLKQGSLRLSATVRITIPGQKATVSHHVMRVYVKRHRRHRR